MTVNEALNWMKELKQRRVELVSLREENAGKQHRLFGEKEIIKEPVYDVKKIDKVINRLSKEIRILDTAIKHTNAVTEIVGYEQNESVLGEIE